MRARYAVVSGQYQVELQSKDVPALAGDEVLIETEWTVVSAGTELANYCAKDERVFQPNQWCSYPWASGYGNVGIVRAVGERVTRAKVGQRVFNLGPHASRFTYAESRLLVPVPDDLDPALACASRMAGVATTAVIVAELPPSPTVAVLGLGMVGNLAAQAFRICGGTVVGVDPNATRRSLAARCGIAQTLGGSNDEVHAALKALNGGQGPQIVVDAVGHSAATMQAVRAVADSGQVIILGSPREPLLTNVTPMLADIHYRWITVRGALEWNIPVYPHDGIRHSLTSKQVMIFDWLRRGELRLEELISHRLSPDDVKTAYDGLLKEPETYTGVLFDWSKLSSSA